MTWKIKDKYKGHQPTNFNIPLDRLLQHQIEDLSEAHKKLYFEKREEVKKNKRINKRIEDL